MNTSPELDAALFAARQKANAGQLQQARDALRELRCSHPTHPRVLYGLGCVERQLNDWHQALECFAALHAQADYRSAQSLQDYAGALAHTQQFAAAAQCLKDFLAVDPREHEAWVLLARVRQAQGDTLGSHRAWFQAIRHARSRGLWLDRQSAPVSQWQEISQAMKATHEARRAHYWGTLEAIQSDFGHQELQRVRRGLSAYLGELKVSPNHPRQRPKFFFMPDLPQQPYLDPMLQPWAERLKAAYPTIRAEAAELMAQQGVFEPFMDLSKARNPEKYLSGKGAKPSWDAFFFYRHGQRYDANHQACPCTSEVLESIERCEIAHQAPEICFSLLQPGTIIQAHHGVTNTRSVMHLPLWVPSGCALNLLDVGPHEWQEGELMLFDDTFEHEAWNHSEHTRMILLMDCWNPHLRGPEKRALKALIEAIDRFENDRALSLEGSV